MWNAKFLYVHFEAEVWAGYELWQGAAAVVHVGLVRITPA